MKIGKSVKRAAVCLLLIAGAFGGYRYYQGQKVAQEATAVETAEVRRLDLKSTVSATGTLRGFRRSQLENHGTHQDGAGKGK